MVDRDIRYLVPYFRQADWVVLIREKVVFGLAKNKIQTCKISLSIFQ